MHGRFCRRFGPEVAQLSSRKRFENPACRNHEKSSQRDLEDGMNYSIEYYDFLLGSIVTFQQDGVTSKEQAFGRNLMMGEFGKR